MEKIKNYIILWWRRWNGAEVAEGLQNGRRRRRLCSSRRRRGGLTCGASTLPIASSSVSCNGGCCLFLLFLFKGRLQVANVVDDVLNHFQFADFTVARHVRHQLFQFAQVLLNFDLFYTQRRRRRCRFHHFLIQLI